MRNKCIPLLRKFIDPTVQLPEKITETAQEMILQLTGEDLACCPQCQKGKVVKLTILPKPTVDTS